MIPIVPPSLARPETIVAGVGCAVPAVVDAVRSLSKRGRTVLYVTGANATRHAAVETALRDAGYEVVLLRTLGEPTTGAARTGTKLARDRRVSVVVAIGGGSTIDLAKAIAALATNEGDPLDYLEVIGRGQPLSKASLPLVAVPTTAGTGSEATKNAVLADPDARVKVSLRHESMLPRVAILDPALTYEVAPDVTAATGMDALTQVLEPYVSIASTPETDVVCLEGMRRAARSLRRAYRDGRDGEARTDLMLASFYGGVALANAKLGAVHGFAGPLGGAFRAPHGAICARLLPLVIEANLEALRARAPSSAALGRYDMVARTITGDDHAVASDAIAWTAELARDLAIPGLATYGMGEADVPVIAERAERASSMKGNPIVLMRGELESILRRAL